MGAGGDGAVVEEEEATGFEVGIVVPKLPRDAAAEDGEDCLARLVSELEAAGLLVDRVRGVPAEFIKVRPPASFCTAALLIFGFSFPCQFPTREQIPREESPQDFLSTPVTSHASRLTLTFTHSAPAVFQF